MKVGIDASTWTNRRGYGRFTRGIVTSLVAQFPEHEFVLVADDTTVRESDFPDRARICSVSTAAQQAVAAAADGSRAIRDIVRMGQAASALHADVFLFPTTFSFFPMRGRTPVVSVMHDASAEHHPELIFPRPVPRLLWQLKTWLARRQTSQLVTVSEAARVQIASAFNIARSGIEVIGEGVDSHFRVFDDSTANQLLLRNVRSRYALPEALPIVLYVGGISPHKNLQTLLHAVAASSNTHWHLALVGDYTNDNFLGCHDELAILATLLGIASRVTYTGFVPDEDLALLYNGASLFVLPSLTEGFGLPVLEAMACGLPVAVSNTTSLPEVVGDAGAVFNPLLPAEIASVIDNILSDAELRSRMRVNGVERAKAYSWNASASALMQILVRTAQRTITHR